MYKDNILLRYLDDLAAKLPAPGGGSASAMAAALGAALLSMVINFTLGKPKYAEYEKELARMLQDSERLRAAFLRLVDEDVAAYSGKDPQRSLDVPLEICRLCHEAAGLCPPLCRKGNVNLASDVAVAIELIEAAFAGAYCNVDINLKMLKDNARTQALRQELDGYQRTIYSIRHDTEVSIGKIVRG
ncbi:MAG: cyclodeaminase/cyclohydrolase family protein [Candidatus Omnitrophota bacterium]